jgi:hypothetical protein
MIIFGITFNPIPIFLFMKQHRIRYGLDKSLLFCNNVIFSNAIMLTQNSNRISKDKRVLVFDALEKLITIEGVIIINKEKEEYIKNFLLNNSDIGNITRIKINKIDFVKNILEENKNTGLMNLYNTNIYKITLKELREQIKQAILSYISGTSSNEQINKQLMNIINSRRISKIRTIIEDLIKMINSEEFTRIRQSVILISKKGSKVSRDVIENISLDNKVEAFDVHYFYSVLNKSGGKNK